MVAFFNSGMWVWWSWLEIDSFDETAHAVIVIFDETSEEYFVYSLQMTTSILVFYFGFLVSLMRLICNCVNVCDTETHKAYPVELAQFHSVDYMEFLQQISPDTQDLFKEEMRKSDNVISIGIESFGSSNNQYSQAVLSIFVSTSAKEAMCKKCDQAAFSGDREAYAPEFNQ
ncbi:hypothetical protein Tco_1032339 [Tanacetum coccineum]|uniref:Uncharacterized protein n=1 Tax=Tanacetum coccineum TaxID=301880 RepID=A0ABQ5GCM3_9ASTR